jgi:hypothetical protein
MLRQARRPKKGQVKIGFDLRSAGMGSQEDVVKYLDEEQKDWEVKNPDLMPTQTEDYIQSGGNCIIGGISYAGQRIFTPVSRRKSKST